MTKDMVEARESGAIQTEDGFAFIFADAVRTVDDMRSRQEALLAESQAIVAMADEQGRDMSDEEASKIEANATEVETLNRQISLREKATMEVSTGRRATSEPVQASVSGKQPYRVPATPKLDAKGGFMNFGDFGLCVREAEVTKQIPDRLRAAATTYGNEGTGADGGFAVPPEFANRIWEKTIGEENLANRCDQLLISGNSITLPKDETTDHQSSGGVLAYWESEGSSVTASKPSLELATMRLAKCMALVPVSEELLEDAPALESYLLSRVPRKMVSKINTAIISGTGVGQPLGFLNSPSLVTVAKETSQTADTVRYANIVKMYSRMYAPCRSRAIWLINQDIEPQLLQMAFDPASTSLVPVYLPPNGAAGSPYGTLLGRPVVAVQAAPTLGDVGDISLVDLSQYMTILKSQGGGRMQARTDVSIHLYFDQALTTYRFTFRINGMPAWSSAITPQHGTGNTLSAFVTLAERS